MSGLGWGLRVLKAHYKRLLHTHQREMVAVGVPRQPGAALTVIVRLLSKRCRGIFRDNQAGKRTSYAGLSEER